MRRWLPWPARRRAAPAGALAQVARWRRWRVRLRLRPPPARPVPLPRPGPTALPQPAPASPGGLAAAARRAALGRPGAPVPVETTAATRSRVRTAPALLVTALLLAVAADRAGSLYLREAMGVRLYEANRAALLPPSRSVVVDAEGRRVGTLAAPEAVREIVEELPPVFVDALVRWEDARFRSHDGVDRYRMFGALAALLRGDPQGGSTLTMQLAKLVKKDSARTLRRKLEDIALALALDHRLGKDEVLRAYANQAYFGSGVYGLGQACRYYFNRDKCHGLAVHEAAYLVALLRAPAELSRDEGRARARRDAVIEALREPAPAAAGAPAWRRGTRAAYVAAHRLWEHRLAGRLETAGRYPDGVLAAARAAPLRLARRSSPPAWPFVLETARQELERRLGSSVYADGLRVRLSVAGPVQAAAERALADGLGHLRSLQQPSGADAAQAPDDLDGGVVVVDPRTGHLLAYVPGADFRASQVPFADRPIQVGSSLKPFVYAEFLEQGLGDLDTRLRDGPICFGGWCPKNYDKKYRGDVPVWFALSRSLNTVAVRAAERGGVDALVARLKLLGVRSALAANLPMALGASELTLLELGGLYASLYDGRVAQPRLVLEVIGREGETLYGGDEPRRPRALRPATARSLRAALSRVLGPGGTAGALGRDLEEHFRAPPGAAGAAPQIACKTGTHDSFTRVGMGCLVSDSDWGPLAIVTYVGHRVPRPLGEGLTGGRVAGPIVASLVKALTAGTRAAGVFRPFPADDEPAPEPPARAEGAAAPPPLPEPLRREAALVREAAFPRPPEAEVRRALAERSAADPPDAALSLARASMAAPLPEPALPEPPAPAPQAREEAGLAAVPGDEPSDAATRAPAPEAAAAGGPGEWLASAAPSASPADPAVPPIVAPRDWSGLRVLDTDVVEAAGPALVRSFLEAGGREEDLAELAPLLSMTVERRVVHQHRLLDPGFSERPISDRLFQLGDRVAGSLARMLDEHRSARLYRQPDTLAEVVADVDADRRIERIYRFERPLRALRATRHHPTSQLLALELVDADGTRRSWVRRGDRMAALALRRVTVNRGSLEPAWLQAGLASAQLDALRSLLGASIDIDRIPGGFALDVLLADGALLAADAALPRRDRRTPAVRAAAVLAEGACLSDDGVPCPRRLLPLPLAEARLYSRRGAVRDGPVLLQRAPAGAPVLSPVAGRVALADEERGLVAVQAVGGPLVRLEGLLPRVAAGDEVAAADVLGRVDPRETLVVRLADASDAGGRLRDRPVLAGLPAAGAADPALRAVAGWWYELLAWVRGERPELRRSVVALAPGGAATTR